MLNYEGMYDTRDKKKRKEKKKIHLCGIEVKSVYLDGQIHRIRVNYSIGVNS